MDFYKFINSNDVREYLREIRYPLTVPEAAFIVYWCSGITLEEKIAAWQEIINTMPDCALEERLNLMRIDSFHSFLRDYIDLQKQSIKNFISGAECIYGYAYKKDEWYEDHETLFPDYESCVQYCKQDVLSDASIDKIRIWKCALYPHQRGRSETITFNNNMEIESVECYTGSDYQAEVDRAFEGMCFDFPSPFRRGDVLIDYRANQESRHRPFVLFYLTTWGSEEMMKKGFHAYDCPNQKGWKDFDRVRDWIRRNGDSSDMCAVGISVDEGCRTIYRDSIPSLPIDLEYYREPLKGLERQLQVISCYEKGYPDVDHRVLAEFCTAIRAEEYAKQLMERCTSSYLEETLKKTGILPADKET